MAERACAACDCKLNNDPIVLTIGEKTVEVCCAECAQRLKEAHTAAAGRRRD